MRLFMWQTDLVAVAKFLDECLELVYTAGPLMRARHLISPEVAGTDVTPLSLSLRICQQLHGEL